MRNLITLVQKIWRDPVWSKIIATALIGLAAISYEMLRSESSADASAVPSMSASNSGNGAILIQGSGNTITTRSSDSLPLQDTPPQRLFGTWKGITSQRSPSGDLVTTGYTRLTETGEYSFSGEMLIHLPIAGRPSELRMKAVAAGTWHSNSNGDKFVIVAADSKLIPDIALERASPLLLSNLENINPKGASQEYTIVELTDTHLRASGTDIRGNPIQYEATRQ